jgi:hypothetical protein
LLGGRSLVLRSIDLVGVFVVVCVVLEQTLPFLRYGLIGLLVAGCGRSTPVSSLCWAVPQRTMSTLRWLCVPLGLIGRIGVGSWFLQFELIGRCRSVILQLCFLFHLH